MIRPKVIFIILPHMQKASFLSGTWASPLLPKSFLLTTVWSLLKSWLIGSGIGVILSWAMQAIPSLLEVLCQLSPTIDSNAFLCRRRSLRRLKLCVDLSSGQTRLGFLINLPWLGKIFFNLRLLVEWTLFPW